MVILIFLGILFVTAACVFAPIIWWESHMPYSNELKISESTESNGDDD